MTERPLPRGSSETRAYISARIFLDYNGCATLLGSNVAVVLAAAMLVCGWCRIRRRWRPVVAGACLAGFVVLCRPEPSVLRAAVMGAIGLLGLSTSRRRMGLPALAAAVIVLLCVDPWLARSYGFALATLATLGLLLVVRSWGG